MTAIGATSIRRLLSAAVLICILGVPAFPQSGTGVIRGTVYDAANAAVPAAPMVLTHVATNTARDATTNELGLFVITGLVPGDYTLTVQAKGFKKWTGSLNLVAGQTAVVEPKLEVGTVEAVVEVQAAAPVITTESSEVGSVKDNVRIEQLPLNGRSVTNLFDLTPGVEGGANPRVNGMKVGAAEMTLDGVSLVDRFGGGMARVQPGLDTVQEFRIETAGSGAQYSRPSTITLVTKGGTNQFHGSLFETFRNNGAGLLARKRQDGNTAAFLARNEFGASAGGPVVIPKVYDGRNKTFWFAAYEALRQRQKTYYQDTVPTDALWAGDFSSVTDGNLNKYTIYDPLTTNAQGLRTPFLGNKIPSSRINPFYPTMQSVTHLPTSSVSPFLGYNLQEWYPVMTDMDNLTLRFDQNFNEKNILSGRYTHSQRRYKQLGGLYGAPRTDITNGGGTGRNDADVYNASVRYTHTFTPTLMSETLFAVHRALKGSGTMADSTAWANKLGLPNPFGETGWPTMYSASGETYFSWDADNRKNEHLTAYIVQPNFTWVKGAHTILFGGQYRQELNNIRELQQSMGEHDFTGGQWTAQYDPSSDNSVAYTGDGTAAMALGLGSYYSAQFNRGYFYFRQKEIGAYIQDTWKVSTRLTINLGLRYDKWTPYKEKYDRLVNVNLDTLAKAFQVVTPGTTAMESIPGLPASMLQSWKNRGLTWTTADAAGLPGRLIPADNNNFGPRVGFAYKLTPKIVLRGSYGEYFWTLPLSQILQASRTNPPFNLRYENPIATADGTGSYGIRTAPLASYFLGKATIPIEGVVDLPTSARGMVPLDYRNWRDSHARTWHFTLEHEFMKMTAVRLSYIGTHGSDMEQKVSINARESEFNYVARTRLAPPSNRDLLRVNKDWAFGGNGTNKTGYSNTNTLQAEVERRFSNGLALQWFYVFTRALTTSDSPGFSSGGGAINSTNGIFMAPENINILGGGNQSYDQLLRLGYQNSSNIPAHHMRYNGIYDLPFGKGKKFASGANRLTDALIGGWQVAAIGEWRSGYWMGVNASEYLFGNPSLSDDKRLLLYYGGRQRRLWFAGDFSPTLATNVDQNALQALVPLDRGKRMMHPVGLSYNNQIQQVLANGTVRNTPITDTVSWNSRAFMKGPGAWNADISAFKNFTLTERVKLRFTADFFNAFNHPVDAVPDVTTGLQDLSTQPNDPRTIQLSLRLSW
jgi:hypothetical protein